MEISIEAEMPMAGMNPAIGLVQYKKRWVSHSNVADARKRADDETHPVEASIRRFDLDDCRAEVVADPQHRTSAGLVDEDAPDIGHARQQIFRDFLGLGVEP